MRSWSSPTRRTRPPPATRKSKIVRNFGLTRPFVVRSFVLYTLCTQHKHTTALHFSTSSFQHILLIGKPARVAFWALPRSRRCCRPHLLRLGALCVVVTTCGGCGCISPFLSPVCLFLTSVLFLFCVVAFSLPLSAALSSFLCSSFTHLSHASAAGLPSRTSR